MSLNQGAERIYGYTAGGSRPAHFDSHAAGKTNDLADIMERLQRGEAIDITNRCGSQGWPPIDVSSRSRQFAMPTARSLAHPRLCVISQRKQADAELSAAAARRLRQPRQSDSCQHEPRNPTPLTAILAMPSHAGRKTSAMPPEHIAVIKRNGEHLCADRRHPRPRDCRKLQIEPCRARDPTDGELVSLMRRRRAKHCN